MGDLIVGIDVGGTFTDVVAVDTERGMLFTTKVPSQPQDPEMAFVAGLEEIIALAGAGPGDVARLVHGTTIATNAVLERKGAVLGILTTRGFEDILAIGRMKRTSMYDLMMDAEEPLFLAPRRRTVGIPERVNADGQVREPLDEAAVVRDVDRLRREYGITSVAVCYLFSYLHPEHERRTAALIHEHFPDLQVSLSSDVNPKFREYERLVVTAFDAYLRPVIGRYVDRLERTLKDHRFECAVQIMQSNGGITSAATVSERPVATILSGPAAGVVAGASIGSAAGFNDLVTIDIGGTSCDVALVRGGKIYTSSEGKLNDYPLRIPMIDVHTIGSGGGSIAWIDPAGGLKVGPESAGARPGPACYGLGGTEPTVTDASLVLGYLNPSTYAGGFDLALDLARDAIKHRVADPLNLDATAAAAGIHEIVNVQMAEAARLVSIQRGYDLRGIALVAQGGAGPVHSGRLLDLLDAQAVVVPARPGVSSAYGLLLADIRHEFPRPYARRFEDATNDDLAALLAEIDAHCGERMCGDGVPLSCVVRQYFAEMRYVGQSYELDVPFPNSSLDESTLPGLLHDFHQTHDMVYGYHSSGSPVEFIGVRGVFRHQLPAPPDEKAGAGESLEASRIGYRAAYFSERGGFVETPIFDRFDVPVESIIPGPAILEQSDTTTVVYPRQTARFTEAGSIVITQTRGKPK